MEASAPAITGNVGGTPAQTTIKNELWGWGCYGNNLTDTRNTCNSGGANQPIHWCKFDASLSSPIYGNSDTLTPLSQTCRFSIRY